MLPQHTIIHNINAQLQYIIRTHYKKHKLNDTINQFQDFFCINNAIAKIYNNQLKKRGDLEYCPAYAGKKLRETKNHLKI